MIHFYFYMMIRLKFVSIESVFYMVVRKYHSLEPSFMIKDYQIACPSIGIFLQNTKIRFYWRAHSRSWMYSIIVKWNFDLKHPVESELRWYEMSEINLQIGIANVNLHRTHKHISVMVLQSYVCRRQHGECSILQN